MRALIAFRPLVLSCAVVRCLYRCAMVCIDAIRCWDDGCCWCCCCSRPFVHPRSFCRSAPIPAAAPVAPDRCCCAGFRRLRSLSLAPPPLASPPHLHCGSRSRRCSLYVKGAFLGFCRGQRKQSQNKHLLSIDGVKSTADSAFYMGKRVAYIYRAKAVVKGTHYRVIWGRIARPHGTNGVVRAYFRSNLPPRAMGASVRVMLYPSRV